MAPYKNFVINLWNSLYHVVEKVESNEQLIFNYKKRKASIQATLVIRGLFICEFTLEIWFKIAIFQSKMEFLSANSRFAVQNDGTYLPRITRETCTGILCFCISFYSKSLDYLERDKRRYHKRMITIIDDLCIAINCKWDVEMWSH